MDILYQIKRGRSAKRFFLASLQKQSMTHRPSVHLAQDETDKTNPVIFRPHSGRYTKKSML